ncbi:MarR family winged helix-turn-helix transcriptional regulator [Phytohabitans suffuscus]|uniref:MarR family transcriptional regulator n=1 Tax=Phytohabitans suffuscus TaxID=624315 RepID=A0A6F8YUT8_9ACTN|nr:MarR family transcriptional regulator [Phytohabitans suffuscus]BCB89920.1 MarR family transcriptional regulator [Phytohabitans suffuscus]
MSEDARWLTEQESVAWVALADLMLRLPAVLDAQLLRDSRITLFDYLVLSNLSMHPERMSRLSDLAKITSSSLSRLSNVVKRLEQRGLLRREPDPDNGRYTNAILTEAGWDLVVAAAPGHVHAVRKYVIDGLSDEQIEALRSVACHVNERVRESGEC